MAQFQRKTLPFRCTGIDIASPVDQMKPGKMRIARNIRTRGPESIIVGRQGTARVDANLPASGPAHSVYSFDDPVPSPTAFPTNNKLHVRLVGETTSLYEATDNVTPVSFVSVASGLSGKPLTFAVAGSDFSPRPWAFVGDFNLMRKVSSGGQVSHMGLAPPNFAPHLAIGTPQGDGPDIGTTLSPYYYRFQARADAELETGTPSGPGPANRGATSGTHPTLQNTMPSSVAAGSTFTINGVTYTTVAPASIVITLPVAHPDPTCRWIDVFRFGGTLPQWTYIGTISNSAGFTLEDTFNDSIIASSRIMDLDDNQPFLSIDTSKHGSGTLASGGGPGLGCTLTVTAGDNLKPYSVADAPYFPAGTQISVGGVNFTMYRSPTNATTVELFEDDNGNTGGDFVINDPELAHQPLPCIWGPYGGGLSGIFLFACGDPLRAGAIYWTKGNHPESSTPTGVLDITSGGEPLMNGAMYNGQSYVFSDQRMFAMYPTLGQQSDFVAIEVPNSKGLYARWGLCVTPWGIAFVSHDGVYLTAGGAPISLTEDDLSPAFPHESNGQILSAYPAVDGMAPDAFPIPNWLIPDQMRLGYGDGYLYFDYAGRDGLIHTLVGQFDTGSGKFLGWFEDLYPEAPVCHYHETVQDNATAGLSHGRMLMGSNSGFLMEYEGDTDLGSPIAGRVRTPAWDTGGDARPRKLWGDVEVDMDSQCEDLDISAGFDNYAYLSLLATATVNLTGRRRVIGDINSGFGQYAFNIGLDITWSVTAGHPLLYGWTPTWVGKPELTALRVTDWDDCGYPGAKFFQGFKLRADTLGVQRSIDVLKDFGVIAQAAFPVSHPNESTIAYVFTTPFISHLIRLHPTDADFWRIEGIEWIFTLAPELVTTWIGQETTHDLRGYGYHRDSYLAIAESTDAVTLRVDAIGNPLSPFTYTFPALGGGVYDKQYAALLAMKARAWKYSLTSPAGFRLFTLDSEVRVKQWGSPGPFVSKMPFGDLSRQPMPARI